MPSWQPQVPTHQTHVINTLLLCQNVCWRNNYVFTTLSVCRAVHDGVIKWKHFPRYWPFVRRIHRSPVNSPHKGQWRGALMFSLICARINGWVNNDEAGDLRRHRVHYDVIVMAPQIHSIHVSGCNHDELIHHDYPSFHMDRMWSVCNDNRYWFRYWFCTGCCQRPPQKGAENQLTARR